MVERMRDLNSKFRMHTSSYGRIILCHTAQIWLLALPWNSHEPIHKVTLPQEKANNPYNRFTIARFLYTLDRCRINFRDLISHYFLKIKPT